jgi:adenylate kinase
MPVGPRIVLLGKPGSGKGTQAALLSEHYEVEHLSTGDVFRAAIKHGTPIGEEVKVFMDTGELVPDEIVIRVVEQYFAEGGPMEDGFILDGFPRTLVQAEALERVLVSHPLDVVLDIDVPTEVVLDRIAGRRACVNCGATYHVHMPPAHLWVCDVCGGDVVQRDDDTDDAIRRRLQLYDTETKPLIDYYSNRGMLVTVDGLGTTDQVADRLTAAIDRRREQAGA